MREREGNARTWEEAHAILVDEENLSNEGHAIAKGRHGAPYHGALDHPSPIGALNSGAIEGKGDKACYYLRDKGKCKYVPELHNPPPLKLRKCMNLRNPGIKEVPWHGVDRNHDVRN